VPQPAPPEGSVGAVQEKIPGARPRLALTLAGGGARGAAEVGVLKVLEAAGIRPDFVAGSSMGAVVGALYCAGTPVSRIEQMFLDGEMKKAFIPRPVPLQTCLYTTSYGVKRLLRKKPLIGLYSGNSIRKFVGQNLPANRQNIECFPIPFSAISVNVLDTRPVWISKGPAMTAVSASACPPGIYRPVEYEGKELVDGGLRANLPTKPAIAAGARVVVAVRLYSTLDAAPPGSFRTIKSYADRMASMALAEIEAKGTADADVVVDPNIGNLPMWDFRPQSMAKAIAAGEVAARKMLPDIRRKLQQTDGMAQTKESGRRSESADINKQAPAANYQ